MNRENSNFDVASISRPGKTKRSNYIQDAMLIERSKIKNTAKFIRVFADMFLKREAGSKSYF